MPRGLLRRLALALTVAACALMPLPAQAVQATLVTANGVMAPRVTPPKQVHVYASPSWWRGTCDAANWNARAVAMGFRRPDHPNQPIVGAHPLGASYLGFQVCGPLPGTRVYYEGRAYTVPDVLWSLNQWGYPEWQCTELAFRFMYRVYGVRPYPAAGGTVVPYYSARADGGGLVRYRNGTRFHAPAPGDIISFSGDYYGGHVAVVAAVLINKYGNGLIKLLTQHDTANGWRIITIHNWRVASLNANGALPAYGWLHDPRNRGA